MLKLINNPLNNRFQRDLPNDHTSDWLTVKAGVPQESILGPLCFLFTLMIYHLSSFQMIAHDTDASGTALDSDFRMDV